MNTTSTTQLEELLKGEGKVIVRPIGKLRTGKYVINLDDDLYDSTKGTHWIGLIVKKTKIFYFDSYGVAPFDQVLALNKPIVWNDVQVQSMSSTACGYFAVSFLQYVSNESDFVKYMKSFKFENIEKNDKILKQYFKMPLKISA